MRVIEFVAWDHQVYSQCLDVQSRTSLRRVLPWLVTWVTWPGASVSATARNGRWGVEPPPALH